MVNKKILHICSNFSKEAEFIISKNKLINVQVETLRSVCTKSSGKKDEFSINTDDGNVHLVIHSPVCHKLSNKSKSRKMLEIKTQQCFDFIISTELTRHLNSDGAHLLSPGWVINWKEHIKTWGFEQETAIEFFKESCSYLMLIDSGVHSNAIASVEEMATWLNLQYKVLPVGVGCLEQKILLGFKQLELQSEIEDKNRYIAEFEANKSQIAMSFDLVNSLSRASTESSLIIEILNVFEMLFAPTYLYYLNLNNQETLFDKYGNHFQNNEIITLLETFSQDYKIIDNDGILLSIKHNKKIITKIYMKGFAHPEYLNHYLNLCLYIKDLIGLIIVNTRNRQQIIIQKTELLDYVEKLEVNENRLNMAQDLGELGNWEYDIEKNLFWASKKAYGLFDINSVQEYHSAEEVENRIVDSHIAHKALLDLIKTGKEYDLTYMLHPDKNNHQRIIHSKAILKKDSEGISIKVIGTIQDVTQRVKFEESIKKKEEQINIISRILWHDVTNSLAAINSTINVFNRSGDPEILNTASVKVKDAVKLIQRMRVLQKTLKKESQLQPISVDSILTSIHFEEDLKVNVDGDCEVLADDALVSVLENIISNAKKHGKATKIDIKIRCKNDVATIEIADNGIGIEDSIKDKVFEKEFISGSSGNTGIGLYIVKKTIERYNGTVAISDNHPKGARFTIKIKKA